MKGGKLKEDKSWTVKDQKTEMAGKINYLGVTFESYGCWKRQKLKTIAKGNQTLVTIKKCLARTPDMRAKEEKTNKEKLCGLSPQANYTDRAAATCRRS
jgi:hypothetical protein